MHLAKMLLAGAMTTLLLTACADAPAPDATPALPKDFATFTVEAGGAIPGRGWEGVVESVRRADLAAQTAGRVTAVNLDVDDSVTAGQVRLRISAVEQQAGANTARAQLRAAEAVAAEAEQTLRRYAALGGGQYVSRQQVDQARATRDAVDGLRGVVEGGFKAVDARFDAVNARLDHLDRDVAAISKKVFDLPD